MKTDENEESLYDLTLLKSISRGNPAFVETMVNIFCDQTPGMVKEMTTAYFGGNLDRMRALAHKIKPSIDNLNIRSLKETIREIENYKGQKPDDPRLVEELNETSAIVNKIIQIMRKEFPEKKE